MLTISKIVIVHEDGKYSLWQTADLTYEEASISAWTWENTTSIYVVKGRKPIIRNNRDVRNWSKKPSFNKQFRGLIFK